MFKFFIPSKFQFLENFYNKIENILGYRLLYLDHRYFGPVFATTRP